MNRTTPIVIEAMKRNWRSLSAPEIVFSCLKAEVATLPRIKGDATRSCARENLIRDAQASNISELRSAAKTFIRNRDGILAYWTTGGQNNAATEGFNRKTRGLLEMSYGFHDYKFLRLRIFDLGEKKSIKD